VDAGAAATLLPLWQLAQELQSNTSAAPHELTAVLDEIEASMDSTQVPAIAAMQLDAAQAGGSADAASASSASSQSALGSVQSAAGMDPGMRPSAGGRGLDGPGPH
jgi:hypothetical protein